VKTAHCEKTANNSKELFVVGFANTVVEPSAVVIKTTYASVTLPAVLRGILNM